MDFWTALIRLAGALVNLASSVLKFRHEIKRDDRSDKENGR